MKELELEEEQRKRRKAEVKGRKEAEDGEKKVEDERNTKEKQRDTQSEENWVERNRKTENKSFLRHTKFRYEKRWYLYSKTLNMTIRALI